MEFHQYSWTRRKESLQRLKVRDKTLGASGSGGGGGVVASPRVNWATLMQKSVNLCRQMTFMPLSGARHEEAAESAVSRVRRGFCSLSKAAAAFTIRLQTKAPSGSKKTETRSCLLMTTLLLKNKGRFKCKLARESFFPLSSLRVTEWPASRRRENSTRHFTASQPDGLSHNDFVRRGPSDTAMEDYQFVVGWLMSGVRSLWPLVP